jgi:predicted membrane-bound mannosyltransferase
VLTFRAVESLREVAARRPVWIRWSVFVVVALLGLAVRLPQLGARPMHTDEAVNAYIVGQLLAGQSFHLRSTDRHGPALAVLALPLADCRGQRPFPT